MRIISQSLIRRCLAATTVSLITFGAASAQDAPQPGASPLVTNARINNGGLPYRTSFDMQEVLTSFQPPEPRTIDLTLRMAFAHANDLAPDAAPSATLQATIVGDSMRHPIAISRGGYFLLPYLDWARQERATIVFNAPSLTNQLETAWTIRLAAGQTLSYADFGRALDEMKTVQKNIPWYRFGLRQVRTSKQDGLKACFAGQDGRIEIDGQPAATALEDGCQVLAFDPALATRAGTIAFVGTLDSITLHDVPAPP